MTIFLFGLTNPLTDSLGDHEKTDVYCEVISTRAQVVGCRCTWIHTRTVPPEFPGLAGVFWGHMLSSQTCAWTKEHQFPFVCTCKKTNCHRPLEACHWQRVQKCQSAFRGWCKHCIQLLQRCNYSSSACTHKIPRFYEVEGDVRCFWEKRWNVPQCVGAIDGSTSPIIAPDKYTCDYFNRKAVVDGKGFFWDLCVGYPGSVHDARVLRQSFLWNMLNDGQLLSQNKVHISDCDVGYYLILWKTGSWSHFLTVAD